MSSPSAIAATQDQIAAAIQTIYGPPTNGGIVVFGAAVSGPVGIPVTVSRPGEAYQVFGQYINDVFSVDGIGNPAGDPPVLPDTSKTLTYSSRGSVFTAQYQSTFDCYNSAQLSNLSVSGTSVSFGSTELPAANWLFSYQPIANRYLVADGVEAILSVNGANAASTTIPITIVRINGTHASVNIPLFNQTPLALDETGSNTISFVYLFGGNIHQDSDDLPTVTISTSPRGQQMLSIHLPLWTGFTTDVEFIVDQYQTAGQVVSELNRRVLAGSSRVAAYTNAPFLASQLLSNGSYTFAPGSDGMAAETFSADPANWYTQLASAIPLVSLEDVDAVYVPLLDPDNTTTDNANRVTCLQLLNSYLTDLTYNTVGEVIASPTVVMLGLDSPSDAELEDLVATPSILTLGCCLSDIYTNMPFFLDCCSLTVGTVHSSFGTHDAAIFQTLYFETIVASRSLSGLQLGTGITIDNVLTQYDISILKEFGIQACSNVYNIPCLEHEFSLIMNPSSMNNPDISGQDPYCYLHVTRTKQLILTRLRQALKPYVGKTSNNQPASYGPIIESVLISIPTIYSASYTSQYLPVDGILNITIEAVLVTEFSFKLLVSI